MKPEHLSELQMDALREVGGIGAGHAATALSQLVDRPISLDVPTIGLLPIGEVPHIFGGPEQLVAGVYCRLLGDIGGSMLFVASRTASLALLDLLRGRPLGTYKSFRPEEESLFGHAAAIVVSAYLSAVARLADLSLLPSSPAFALDMAGAILEVAMLDLGTKASDALVVRTRFHDAEVSVDAVLLFLPDPDSLDVLLGRLGVV